MACTFAIYFTRNGNPGLGAGSLTRSKLTGMNRLFSPVSLPPAWKKAPNKTPRPGVGSKSRRKTEARIIGAMYAAEKMVAYWLARPASMSAEEDMYGHSRKDNLSSEQQDAAATPSQPPS